MNDYINPLRVPTSAPLRVTYTDGTKETFQNVRYRVTLSETDPVSIRENGTVQVETSTGRVITILNVRWMEFL